MRNGGLSDPAAAAVAAADAAASSELEPDSVSETWEWLELPGAAAAGGGGGGGSSSSSSSSSSGDGDKNGDNDDSSSSSGSSSAAASSFSSSSSSSSDDDDLHYAKRTPQGLQSAAGRDALIVAGNSLGSSRLTPQQQCLRVADARRRIKARDLGMLLLAPGASTRAPGLPAESGGSGSRGDEQLVVTPELAAKMIADCAAGKHELGYGQQQGQQLQPPFRKGGPADCALHYTFGTLTAVVSPANAARVPGGLRRVCLEVVGERGAALELFKLARRSRVSLILKGGGGKAPPTAEQEAKIARVLDGPEAPDLLRGALALFLPVGRAMIFHILRELVDLEDARRVQAEAAACLAAFGLACLDSKEKGEEEEEEEGGGGGGGSSGSGSAVSAEVRVLEAHLRDFVAASFRVFDDAAAVEEADVFLNAYGYCLPESLVGEVVCTVEEAARGSFGSSGSSIGSGGVNGGTAQFGTEMFRKGPLRPAAPFKGSKSSFPTPLYDPAEASRRLACRGGRGAFEQAHRRLVAAAERCRRLFGRVGDNDDDDEQQPDPANQQQPDPANQQQQQQRARRELFEKASEEVQKELAALDRRVKGKAVKLTSAFAPAGLETPPGVEAATEAAALKAVGAAARQEARGAGCSDAEANAALAKAMTESYLALRAQHQGQAGAAVGLCLTLASASPVAAPSTAAAAAAAAKAAAARAEGKGRKALPLQTAREHLAPIERAASSAALALGASLEEAAAAGVAAAGKEVQAQPWLQRSISQANLDSRARGSREARMPLAAFVRGTLAAATRDVALWERMAKGKPWEDFVRSSSASASRGGKGKQKRAFAMNEGAGPSDAE